MSRINTGNTKSWEDNLLSLIWTLFLLFPAGTIFYFSVPVLCMVLYNWKRKGGSPSIFLLFLLALSLLFNLSEPYMGLIPMVRIGATMIVLFIFGSYRGLHVKFTYVLFALSIILLSQISFMFNIPGLQPFFESVYSNTETIYDTYGLEAGDLSMADITGGSRRVGGLFMNPNICASYVTLIFAVGLCELRDMANKKYMILLCSLALLSVILSGSRTAFLVLTLIFLFYCWQGGAKINIFSLVLPLFVGVLLVFFFSHSELRMFKFEEGMDSSFGLKIQLFYLYLSEQTDILKHLFGCGDISVTSTMPKFGGFVGTDFDFGNIYISYGIAFYVAYMVFLISIFKKVKKEYRILFFVLLWSFSNSILISYRMCPIFFLSLGVLYQRSLQSKN